MYMFLNRFFNVIHLKDMYMLIFLQNANGCLSVLQINVFLKTHVSLFTATSVITDITDGDSETHILKNILNLYNRKETKIFCYATLCTIYFYLELTLVSIINIELLCKAIIYC